MRRGRLSSRARLAVGAGLVAFLILIGSGAAQAAWTALSTAVTSTVSTGTPKVTFADMSALNRTYNFTTGSTSSVNIAAVTITDSGNTPFTSYALAATNTNATYAAKINLWIWVQSGTTCGSSTVGTAGTLAAPPALPTEATVGGAVGSVINLCVATQLNTSVILTAGQTVSATLTVTAKIGNNWQATSSSVVTQSSVLPNVTAVGCTNVGVLPGLAISGATITWTVPAGSTGTTVYAGTTVVGGTKNISGNTMTLDAVGFGVGNATSVRIVAVYAGGVESTGVVQNLTPLLGGVLGTSCG